MTEEEEFIICANGHIEGVAEDTDEILEDTSAIDKKTTLLIYLWIVDKVSMFILLWLSLTLWR